MENIRINADGTAEFTSDESAFLAEIRAQARKATEELIEAAGLQAGDIFVVGCSTSEVTGNRIGKASVPVAANALLEGIYPVLRERGIYIAAQCCEHLNRALIVEREALPFADPVNVVPQPKAGGSFATQAYAHFSDPIAVEAIRADAGLDIGLTMIGMHLKPVAVPLRLVHNRVGEALVSAARTRPKFIGGIRAQYDETLL